MPVFRLFLVVAILSVTGCAGVSKVNVELTENNSNRIVDQPLVISKRGIPPLVSTTPASAQFGLLGALLSGSKGSRIVRQYSLEDPANYIAAFLVKDLASEYGVKFEGQNESLWEGTDNADIVALPSSARYVLDVQTVTWGYIYIADFSGTYRTLYSVKLRLVDTVDKVVMSEGFCESPLHTDSGVEPSVDELLTDSAYLLKQKLGEAAAYCIKEFRDNTLNIGSQLASAPDPNIFIGAYETQQPDDFPWPIVAGIYASEIKDKQNGKYLGNKTPVVIIEQRNDRITGSFDDQDATLEGAIVGGSVYFTWKSSDDQGKGSWEIKDEGKYLVGNLSANSAGEAHWTLKQIRQKDAQKAGSTSDVVQDVEPDPYSDVSGTYRSKLSKNLRNHFKRTDIEIKLVQSGNKIKGTFVGAKGFIDGEIDGNTIKYKASPPYGNWSISGKWVFTDGYNKATGDAGFHVTKGSWNLTKIE